MNSPKNPKTVHEPLGLYTHTIKVPPGAEWLAIAGQVGVEPNGRIAEGVGPQTEHALKNILACLKANGMAKEDLVTITVYLTDAAGIGEMRTARRSVLGESTVPTSTLLVVSALASPEYLVEIEGWAAKG